MSGMKKAKEVDTYLKQEFSHVDAADAVVAKPMSKIMTHSLVIASGLLSGYIAYRVVKSEKKLAYLASGVLFSYAFFILLDLKTAKKI